jgi:hypothetical protein
VSSKNAIPRYQPAHKPGRASNISRGQAHELKRENREIAHETRHDEHTGGYLSHGEQRNINQQENALNRRINRESR